MTASGHVPRVSTQLPPGVGDQVGEVEAVAREHLGIDLDSWQLLALDHLTAVEPGDGGRWVYSQAGILCPRQVGKTQLMQARILWGLLNGERVVAAAQNLSEAVATWQQLADLFLEPEAPLHRLLARRTLRHGGEAIHLTNGGMYRVVAANRRSARGLRAVDLVFLDEVRELRTFEAVGAITPTQAASPNPQLVAVSNAGDSLSVVLRAWRDRGHAAADGADDPRFCWLEWSAAAGRAVDDRDGWAEATPTERVTEEFLSQQARTLPESQFRTEHLCQFVDSMTGAINPHVWRELGNPDLDGFTAKKSVIAFAKDGHGRAAAIIVAEQQDDGRVRVGLVEGWEPDDALADPVTDRDVAEGVLRAVELLKPRAVVYNSVTAASIAHQLGRRVRKLVDVRGLRFFTACAALADYVDTRRLEHDAAHLLQAHIAAATRTEARTQGYWYLDRTKSTGPIPAAEAAALAVLVASEQRPQPPGVIVLTGPG